MCAGTTMLHQLTSKTTEMCPTGRFTYRPTATFLDVCAWANSNVSWCLRVDQQQRSLMLARRSLATCYIDVPMVDQNLSPSTFLVQYVRATVNSNYSVLAIGPIYWYVIPPHICYQYSYILLQSNTYVDRLHKGDCYAFASISSAHW